MRGLIMSAMAVVLLAGTLEKTAMAQTGAPGSTRQVLVLAGNQWSNERRWQGSGLPYGDYEQTCRNIRNNGYRLDATCQKRNGKWRNTSLNYRYCRGSIVNDNGHLRCTDGGGYGGGGWRGGIPSGSYQQTCRDIRIEGSRLEATCQKRNGGWHNTSLRDFNYCRGRIENDDGHLRCQ